MMISSDKTLLVVMFFTNKFSALRVKLPYCLMVVFQLGLEEMPRLERPPRLHRHHPLLQLAHLATRPASRALLEELERLVPPKSLVDNQRKPHLHSAGEFPTNMLHSANVGLTIFIFSGFTYLSVPVFIVLLLCYIRPLIILYMNQSDERGQKSLIKAIKKQKQILSLL